MKKSLKLTTLLLVGTHLLGGCHQNETRSITEKRPTVIHQHIDFFNTKDNQWHSVTDAPPKNTTQKPF